LDDLQHCATFFRDFVAARGFGAAFVIGAGGEPAVFLHALQQRVERAGADVVTVVAELFEHPITNHLALGGVMQDMHLPEGEQDFTIDELEVHSGGRVAVSRWIAMTGR